jgi:hypothetical protein
VARDSLPQTADTFAQRAGKPESGDGYGAAVGLSPS